MGTRMRIDPEALEAILAFVDRFVPAGCVSVWLTGSRVRGDARDDSDWDVVAFHPDVTKRLFESNQTGSSIQGGPIELVIAHPSHWNDPSPYMAECRASGIKLR
jgi:predicted nucleotidyltransferase